jgi:phosphate transport system permease protein
MMGLNSSFTYRKVVDRGMAAVCAICFVAAFIPLVSVLWLVISKGAAGLSWAFFTELPKPVGEEGGGIGNALVGTLYMVGLACVIGLPLGVGAGVYLAEKGDGTVGNTVRFMAEVLSGVPSIVIGIVAYALVVIPMGHFSAWAGGVALAILMIPMLARATEELVRLVPGSLREASLALGVPNWKTSLRVIIRTAMGGIVTACLLAVARAAGETAPLLFTALNNQYWNVNPGAPTASLTVAIYNYAISPYDDWHAKAWTASLVLLIVVGLLNIASRVLTRNRLKGAR